MYQNLSIMLLRLMAIHTFANLLIDYKNNLYGLQLIIEWSDASIIGFVALAPVALQLLLVLFLWFEAPFIARKMCCDMKEEDLRVDDLPLDKLYYVILPTAGFLMMFFVIDLAVFVYEDYYHYYYYGDEISHPFDLVALVLQFLFALLLIAKPKQLWLCVLKLRTR